MSSRARVTCLKLRRNGEKRQIKRPRSQSSNAGRCGKVKSIRYTLRKPVLVAHTHDIVNRTFAFP